MTAYAQLQTRLQAEPHSWLVTGVAGFIGSNLLEALLKLGQRVVGLDNFATGHQRNLDEVQILVSLEQWANFNFIHGDIRNLQDCQKAMTWAVPCGADFSLPWSTEVEPTTTQQSIPVDFVLHQAALGSVRRSVADPLTTNDTNITGFLNMLVTARDARVKRFDYAASSSTYGDHPGLPKVEDTIGKPLSPYAAVIPKWIASLIQGEPVYINGDGETSRDFRAGDVRHSLADISKAATRLGYAPTQRIGEGLALAMRWYIGQK